MVGHGDNNESNVTTIILILLKNKFIEREALRL